MLKKLLPSLALLLCISSAYGQFQERGSAKGPQIGELSAQKWQLGLTVSADSGPCTGLVGYVPLFNDWPEQQVSVLEEKVSDGVKLTYQMIDGIKVMLVNVPNLPPGEKAEALITFEVRRGPIVPPQDTSIYELPNTKKLPKDVRPYLAASSGIDPKNPKIRALAKEITADKEPAWKKIEALYDWVRENVKYEKGQNVGSVMAVKNRKGNVEDLVSTFIALCRAIDVPARTVWVPGHCYAEFYLADDDGQGHWFPCELKETRSFGGIQERRPVLMKGDNFHPPWAPRDRQRMLSEYLTGSGGKPKHRFIRQAAP